MQQTDALRTVAVFEAVKGVLAVLTGFGVLTFIGDDLEQLAATALAHFHFHSSQQFPLLFLAAVARVADARPWWVAAFVAGYAMVRFVEAYGLWLGRRWAEWFAALSAGIYLPFEFYALSKEVTWISVGALAINILVIGLMVAALRRSHAGELRHIVS